MLFNSWEFILFFVAVLGVAQALKRAGTAWKVWMISASCYFYGQWSWKYLLLILFTATIDYTIARRLANAVRPAHLLAVSVCTNLGVLAMFKYANFAISSFNSAAEAGSFSLSLAPLEWALPVGISFYTFQNLSYTIDVYRGDIPPRPSVIDYALFTTFFPQLLAGPIVRASEFFSQLDRPSRILSIDVRYAAILIAFGFVKKIVLADSLAGFVDQGFEGNASTNAWQTLAAIYAFAFQIYFDFSGYTDIAIGLALFLGFRFPRNFDYPYAADSFQGFWRRWHMTLSRWLRDYLYISLGGSRTGATRTAANLMVTMLLGGLWHGASWTFIAWGALHGAYLVMERYVLDRFKFWRSPHAMSRLGRLALIFHLVCFAWIFFRAPDFATAAIIIGKLNGLSSLSGLNDVLPLFSFLGALLFWHAAASRMDVKLRLAHASSIAIGTVLASCLLALIWLAPAKTVPFIYFQF